MTKQMKTKIARLWKQGRNVWEISQLTGASTQEVFEVVNAR